MTEIALIERLRAAVERLPAGLRDHVLRVEKEALRLAALHGLDTERLRIAALAHDLARAEDGPALIELARRYEVEADEVERASPILLHGPVGARMLERDYGYADPEVMAAIAAHTTARPGMSLLEKALFVADKIEDDKVRRKPGLAEVRALADTDLDAAMLRFLALHLVEAAERSWQVHPRALAARNELLAARQRMGNR
jgi:predicted HD superfamily hydrolase involved in NAD metabolism